MASWVKALSEPRLQVVAERILPPSPAQKQEVGADPAGRPENMPPAVLPALGIQRPPWRLAPAAVAWELTWHVLFGTALESVRRALGGRR